MKTRLFAGLTLAAVGLIAAVAWPIASADDKGAKSASPPTASDPSGLQKPVLPNRKQLMIDKLNHAQQILNGLAKNDRETIAKSAEKLVALSQVAEWLNADKSDEYQFQMTQFRRAAKMIAKKAEEKNIEGVMLAYTEMTMTCLRCHQHERDFR